MRLGNSSDEMALGDDEALYQSIKGLIERSRSQVVAQVNQTLVLTYWQVGKIIKTEVLQAERSQYGEATLKQLAARLSRDYGTGFSYSSLTRMAKFYHYMPDQRIVATLSQQLSWSHFIEVIKIEDELKREFYLQLCADAEVVELMDLEQDNVHVAEYWLQLPPKDVLQAKLHKAMVEAKARLALRGGEDDRSEFG
jgi:hypothetical protein